MAVPVINVIKAFDARQGTVFTFSYTGNQVVGIQFVISRADTLEEVYRNVTDAVFLRGGTVPLKLQGIIPSDAGLENSRKYSMKLRVIDVYRNPTDWSALSYFTCYETPTLVFKDLESGDKIKAPSYAATVLYSQADNERLQSYWFNLYDETLNVISTSKTFYDVPQTSDVVTLNYTFTNLSDDTTYYIRCQGTTIHGMSCDSGPIEINVDYKFYNDFQVLYLSNDHVNGRIEYQGNFKIIWPDEYYEEFDYDDSYIHLEDRQLNYNKGFVIEDDFILWLKGKVPYKNNTFLILYNESYNIMLESVVYDGYMKFKMTASNGLNSYILYSESFQEFDDYEEDFVWCIRRVGHVYQFVTRLTTDFLSDVLVSYEKPDDEYAKTGIAWINGDENSVVRISKANIITSETKPDKVNVPTIWLGGEK